MESFRISGSGGYNLEFFDRSPEDPEIPVDQFWVRLTGPNLSAAIAVDTGYEPRDPTPLFAEMAVRWRGWPGELVWGSLEDEITLRCTQDRSGHVTIAVELRSGWPGWSLSATVETEAGQLERIARDSARFFGA